MMFIPITISVAFSSTLIFIIYKEVFVVAASSEKQNLDLMTMNIIAVTIFIYVASILVISVSVLYLSVGPTCCLSTQKLDEGWVVVVGLQSLFIE